MCKAFYCFPKLKSQSPHSSKNTMVKSVTEKAQSLVLTSVLGFLLLWRDNIPTPTLIKEIFNWDLHFRNLVHYCHGGSRVAFRQHSTWEGAVSSTSGSPHRRKKQWIPGVPWDSETLILFPVITFLLQGHIYSKKITPPNSAST